MELYFGLGPIDQAPKANRIFLMPGGEVKIFAYQVMPELVRGDFKLIIWAEQALIDLLSGNDS